MNKAAFHSAGYLDIELFISKLRVQRFVFSAASIDFPITSFTWQLVVKRTPGDRVNLISLTLGNGLSFPIYEDNVIEARFEPSTTAIEEGGYYWYLVRTDTNEVWLNGRCKVSFGPLDSSGSTQEATINLLNQEVSVEVSAIVQATTFVTNPAPKVIQAACSDETTAITATTGKVSFRMPYAMTLSSVRASLVTAQTSGNIFTVDINENGTSILSTKITIDNTETTSVTAATPFVLSDISLSDDSIITVDVDQIGDGTAKGLKVTLIGT